MDKLNALKAFAYAAVLLPTFNASATTFERPGTWCYQADAGPEAADLLRYLNCAWNHIAGFDTDETTFAHRKMLDIMVQGLNDRVRFRVCGFPGTGINSNGDCGWVDADVIYQGSGTTISGVVPLISGLLTLRDDMAIPLTRVPKDIALKLTMPDGRQRTVENSILELRKPETRAGGLPFHINHALHGLSEFTPGSNDPSPDVSGSDSDPDPTVHGEPGHHSYLHALYCVAGGDNTLQ